VWQKNESLSRLFLTGKILLLRIRRYGVPFGFVGSLANHVGCGL
jgi:hypothetical protein